MAFPSREDELWRRTDFGIAERATAWIRSPRPPATRNLDDLPHAIIERLASEAANAAIIVQRDADIVLEQTHPTLARQGVVLMSLDRAVTEHGERVKSLLGDMVATDYDRWTAIGEAVRSGGVFLWVPDGVEAEIAVRVFQWLDGPGHVSAPRSVIALGKGARATVLFEQLSGEGEAPSLYLGGVEAYLGEDAKLVYGELQDWGRGTYHYSNARVRLGRDAELQWMQIMLGGRMTKANAYFDMNGPGAQAFVHGFMFGDRRQHFHLHTLQRHLMDHATSDLLIKCCLKDRARSVYQGLIQVAEGAQRTDAYQANRNLLFSDTARADSIPGPRDPGERRALYARRDARLRGPGADVLPDDTRPAGERGAASDRRRLLRARAGTHSARHRPRPAAVGDRAQDRLSMSVRHSPAGAAPTARAGVPGRSSTRCGCARTSRCSPSRVRRRSSTSTAPRRRRSRDAVLDAMDRHYRLHNANMHRGVYRLAEEATAAFEDARRRVANFLGAASPREIVFTRNSTEAINLVAYSWARTHLAAGDAIVLTEMEHHANLVPWQVLAAERGVTLRFVPVTGGGDLDLAVLPGLLADGRVKLVSFVHLSNVLGTLNPADEIVRQAKAAGAQVLIDASQSVRTVRSTCARWVPTSWCSPRTRCWAPPGSACCGAGALCSRRCHRSSPAAR